MPLLTVGFPTYDDFDGLYFSVQALRMYQDLDDVELLVVDTQGSETTQAWVNSIPRVRYERRTDRIGTAPAKNQVFALATGDFVLCLDSHVLLAPDALRRLKEYCRAHRESKDLLQGPLWLDDLGASAVATHLSSTWSDGMHGQWATDTRGVDPAGPPFEISSQGMGLFACRRDAWPGFHPRFRGFGGEEGYLQEKFRQHGGQALCLPFLRWVHRFPRPRGTPYKVRTIDKYRNALLGHLELRLELDALLDHFATLLPVDALRTTFDQELRDAGPAYEWLDVSRVHEQMERLAAAARSPTEADVEDDELPARG
jgi:glycosyltransferase involved in cell wall biosynthesis